MKVWSLQCAHGHGFEGWFADEDAYQAQQAGGWLTCPMCGDASIARLPSAPRLNLGAGRTSEPPSPARPPRPGSLEEGVQALWEQAVAHVMAHTEDVGAAFPEEARRIHRGDAPQRPIRGQASADEVKALREDDIEVVPLPLPPAKRSLQ